MLNLYSTRSQRVKTGTKITGATNTLTACTNLDISSATNVFGVVAAKTITASGTTLNEGQIAAARQVSAPIINVLTPFAGQTQDSGVSFAGITTPTQITGPSVSNPTVCTNLDLRSGTNLFTGSDSEQYEWGGYWKNPRTLLTDNTQVAQVYMASYEDDFPGWRYFPSNG